MGTDRASALLAHIADTVTETREEQSAVLALLARILEIGETQTEMLTEILAAARQEPGPSETAQALASLVAAVEANTAAIGAMAEQIGGLPAEIGAEVSSALGPGGRTGSG